MDFRRQPNTAGGGLYVISRSLFEPKRLVVLSTRTQADNRTVKGSDKKSPM